MGGWRRHVWERGKEGRREAVSFGEKNAGNVKQNEKGLNDERKTRK